MACIAWPVRTLAAMSLRRICREQRMACLTYDDGPGEQLTRDVMATLEAFNAKATFFAIGTRARQVGEVLDEASAKGHDIGCHTSGHLHAWKVGRRAVTDIREGYQELAAWVPANGMFRPPYGKMSLATIREIRRRGAPVGWWTIDAGDTHDVMPPLGGAAETLVRDGGGVVLLHDFDRASVDGRERRDYVLRSTELILQSARREGITIRRLGEIIGVRQAVRTVGASPRGK